MPETGIGMFPDVGASYVLPRLPGALGMFLGLTGTRLSGADAVHAGFATHYVPHDRIAAVSAALAEDGVAVLAGFAAPLPPFSLQADRAAIDRCFGAESVGEILRRLASEDTDWARRTLESLHRMSPSAVHWSFRIIRDGARRTLHQCQAAELELVMRVARHAEFHEGVRAMIVDKDRQPQWTPARLEDVDPASTEAMFAPGSLADLQLMASRGPMVNLVTRRAL
jgi:enoyl-CoA hydratase/carnithine racemase